MSCDRDRYEYIILLWLKHRHTLSFSCYINWTSFPQSWNNCFLISKEGVDVCLFISFREHGWVPLIVLKRFLVVSVASFLFLFSGRTLYLQVVFPNEVAVISPDLAFVYNVSLYLSGGDPGSASEVPIIDLWDGTVSSKA